MVRLKRKTKKRITQALAVLLCVLMLFPIVAYFVPDEPVSDSQAMLQEAFEQSKNEEENNEEFSAPEDWKGPYEVVGVNAGDELHIALDEKEFVYVHLLGTDTPTFGDKTTEEVEAANTAYYGVRKMVEGHQVYLVYADEDVNEDELEALVYLDDGTLLNQKILEEGYAKTSSPLPDDVKDAFVNAENKAKKNDAGLWKDFWNETK